VIFRIGVAGPHAMKALTLDDLLPLDEFAGRRREFLEAHLRYLDRYRRVRLGPALTLVFENRQTLWFRVQDILRIARLAEPELVQRELDVYNRLLPGPDRLQAALVIALDHGAPLSEQLERWQKLCGAHLRLHLGDLDYPADLVTCRPEDRCIGAAHWAQFVLDDLARHRLADGRFPAHFSVAVPGQGSECVALSDEVRQSLVDDLWQDGRNV
jgi:hypothetical protein